MMESTLMNIQLVLFGALISFFFFFFFFFFCGCFFTFCLFTVIHLLFSCVKLIAFQTKLFSIV